MCRHQSYKSTEQCENKSNISWWVHVWRPSLRPYGRYHKGHQRMFGSTRRITVSRYDSNNNNKRLMPKGPLGPNGPLARYVKLQVVHASGMPGTFSPPPTWAKPTSWYLGLGSMCFRSLAKTPVAWVSMAPAQMQFSVVVGSTRNAVASLAV